MPFYEPSNKPEISIDYNKSKPVTVIVNFAPDGRMIPIYLRWINHDESEDTLKIDGVVSTKDFVGGIAYCCYITVNGWRRQIILKFYVKEHIWTMEL